MSTEYMESVWGVFKQLFNKGLVYIDTKVLPYSTSCFTHLSSFEAQQNCKEITEVAVTIYLKVVDSSVNLLVWTIAPWKLVGNLAACVNPNSRYVKVKLTASDKIFIVSQNRLPFVFKNSSEFIVLNEITGDELGKLRYEPMFSYDSAGSAKTLPVLIDKYIRDDLGTGIVALSPHFSHDDYRVCLENGIKCDEILCPVDDSGRFKAHIAEVGGLPIAEANAGIIKVMQRRGHLMHLEDVKHKTPHCWRSEVPLIPKVTTTWFIHTQDLTANLKENNAQVNWFHCNSKETMNNNFELSNDWALGRNSYWGTPIPIWSSPSGDEIRCIGSVEELLQLTGGTSISDLHREFLDELVIPSRIPGNPKLRRVPEVFDCWFESAAMPFVQKRSQADFIAEGCDQTSGWFYTTSVLAATLSLPPPSKNIISHGLVQKSDGSKVSKHKHNHSDPMHMVEKYGADALRLYLATTPLMTGENFVLQEDEVKKITENVIRPLYKILYDLFPHFGKAGWVYYGIINQTNYFPNIFDQWILSRAESLIQFYDAELKVYNLGSIIPRIINFISQIRDWYIPIRYIKRKKNDDPTFVLYNIVYKICLVLAPFAPFFAEHIYQILQPYVLCYRKDFLHDSVLPEKSNGLINMFVENKVTLWQTIVEMIREVRVDRIVPIQYRISEVIVIHPVNTFLEHDELMNEIMREVVNVHQVLMTNDRHQFGAILKAELKANSSLHQNIDRTKLEEIKLALRQLNDKEVETVIRNESVYVQEDNIPLDDIDVSYQCDKKFESNFAVISKDALFVVIRMNKDFDYYEEGTRLEIVSTIQKFRKKANVFPSNLATICYSSQDKCLLNAFQKLNESVSKSTNSILKWMKNAIEGDNFQETISIKGVPVTFYLNRNLYKCIV